jgi:hypothetical protein
MMIQVELLWIEEVDDPLHHQVQVVGDQVVQKSKLIQKHQQDELSQVRLLVMEVFDQAKWEYFVEMEGLKLLELQLTTRRQI